MINIAGLTYNAANLTRNAAIRLLAAIAISENLLFQFVATAGSNP